jgi:hypothetical protein
MLERHGENRTEAHPAFHDELVRIAEAKHLDESVKEEHAENG